MKFFIRQPLNLLLGILLIAGLNAKASRNPHVDTVSDRTIPTRPLLYNQQGMPVPASMVVVTCNITLTTGGNPDGALISLSNQIFPELFYSQIAPESGIIVFPDVEEGIYTLMAFKPGFYDLTLSPAVTSDITFDILLEEIRYKPLNLMIDSLTLVATWEEPKDVLIEENFEGLVFPPVGWQALSDNLTGWQATADGSSTHFYIPSHTLYATSTDNSENNNGCCDYLITPELDLTNLNNYHLRFASFFTGEFNQHAFIQISTDIVNQNLPRIEKRHLPGPGLSVFLSDSNVNEA